MKRFISLAMVLFSFAVSNVCHSQECLGDLNGDGRVDILDLDIMGLNFGVTPATYSLGDVNGDGTVDLLDLDDFGTNFGIICPPIIFSNATSESHGSDREGAGLEEVLMSSPGDINGDGVMDLIDLDILGSNFGKSPATFSEGDLNGDGVVDLLDLDYLGLYFGNTFPTSVVASSVPEPTSAVLLSFVFVCNFASRRHMMIG